MGQQPARAGQGGPRHAAPEQLKILELAYFSGYTQAEIARELGIPLHTVKGRTRLGLKKLGGYFRSREAAGLVDRAGPAGHPDRRPALANPGR